jgi:hypothetical protein
VAEAIVREAHTLVTGDAALQKFGKRAPLPIVSPRRLGETLRGPEPPTRLRLGSKATLTLGCASSRLWPWARVRASRMFQR